LTQALTTPSGSDVWHDWGGAGSTVHFAHANGFPPGTYRKLVETLTENHHVVSMAARPLWSPNPAAELQDWFELAGDLRVELERRGLRGILGVGHSLGGVASLLAAADDPGLFRAVVAVDPLVLTGRVSTFWGLMKGVGLGGRLGLVRGARSRRDHWPDRETVLSSYRRKKIFKFWDPEVLDDYINCGTVVKSSDTFRDAAVRRVARELPLAEVAVVRNSTHFVPMERPQELGDMILEFFEGIREQGGSE